MMSAKRTSQEMEMGLLEQPDMKRFKTLMNASAHEAATQRNHNIYANFNGIPTHTGGNNNNHNNNNNATTNQHHHNNMNVAFNSFLQNGMNPNTTNNGTTSSPQQHPVPSTDYTTFPAGQFAMPALNQVVDYRSQLMAQAQAMLRAEQARMMMSQAQEQLQYNTSNISELSAINQLAALKASGAPFPPQASNNQLKPSFPIQFQANDLMKSNASLLEAMKNASQTYKPATTNNANPTENVTITTHTPPLPSQRRRGAKNKDKTGKASPFSIAHANGVPILTSRRVRQKPTHSSRYRGVFYHKNGKPWVARIMCKGKTIHLGYFDNEEDAAKAYDLQAVLLHGPNAKLNFSQTTGEDNTLNKNNSIIKTEATKKQTNTPGSPTHSEKTEGVESDTDCRKKERNSSATMAENAMKKVKLQMANPSSKYRGVCWNKCNKSWKASIKINGINKHLGYFDDVHEAALAYDLTAMKVRGDRAILNFKHENVPTA